MLAFLYIYFPQIPPMFKNPNEWSRLYLAISIVEFKSFRIDKPIKTLGDTQDKSSYNGHYYSDKAPGLSFVAAPFYLAIKGIASIAGINPDLKTTMFILRFICVSIPSLFIFMILNRLLNSLAPSENSGLYALFLVLGTNLFTYSTLFMSHILAAFLCLLSFYLLYKTESKISPWLTFLSGIISGFAILSEYPVALIVFILIFYSYFQLKSIKCALLFCTGILIPTAILMYYNYACFGSPFSTGYHHKTDALHAIYHSQGFVGFIYPKLGSIASILFSPSKGLLFYSPFLVFSTAGYIHIFKKRKMITWVWPGLLIPPAYIIAISSFVDWPGGWTVGPRHLVPALPFLCIPIGIFLERYKENILMKSIFSITGLFSIFLILVCTPQFPYYPDIIRNPAFEIALPMVMEGILMPNFGNYLGLSGTTSILIPLGVIVLGIIATKSPCKYPVNKIHILRACLGILIFVLLLGLFSIPVSKPDKLAAGRIEILLRLQKDKEAILELNNAMENFPDSQYSGYWKSLLNNR